MKNHYGSIVPSFKKVKTVTNLNIVIVIVLGGLRPPRLPHNYQLVIIIVIVVIVIVIVIVVIVIVIIAAPGVWSPP